MTRYFNTAGACNPRRHYMVDIQEQLNEIKKLVDRGEYFTINRARQYGKTTTIHALTEYLSEDYIVLSLDFQMIGNEDFENAAAFSTAFGDYLTDIIQSRKNPVRGLNGEVLEQLSSAKNNAGLSSLRKLFRTLSRLCETADKPVVLIIDEVDSATNNQVFLDFLAQLRAYYLKRDELPTFQSAILVGVYDVKNIRRKIREDEDHKINSPWNIAADFNVNMSFSRQGIAGMLFHYESDHHTCMDVEEISELIYDYTAGYPFLVSRLCKLIDEQVTGSNGFPDQTASWTKKGFLEAVRLLLAEKNTLFESLTGKILNSGELRNVIYSLLFSGQKIIYNPDDPWIDLAMMYGFIRNSNGTVLISNRIFEMRLYNYFLSTNEAQTRNSRRMDIVVDYNGEQFIIELKLWRGTAYHERGEQQLSDYLDYFHLKKGYMLSYNFNQKKQPGVRSISLGDRILVEAVV